MAAPSGVEREEPEPAGAGGIAPRWIAVGLIGTIAAGFGAYALAATIGAGATDANGAVTSASETESRGRAPERVRARGKRTHASHGERAGEGTSALPSASALPPTSAYAVDVREGAKASTATARAAASAPAPAGKPVVFGAREVPRARRFTLRMTGPVAELRGVRDADGFTVIIPGSRAIDRAGPIGDEHPSVARAMILNRGDQSQLTIRFAPGKQPAYQVRGQGAQLEILIEGA
jgi:hypothetical protein